MDTRVYGVHTLVGVFSSHTCRNATLWLISFNLRAKSSSPASSVDWQVPFIGARDGMRRRNAKGRASKATHSFEFAFDCSRAVFLLTPLPPPLLLLVPGRFRGSLGVILAFFCCRFFLFSLFWRAFSLPRDGRGTSARPVWFGRSLKREWRERDSKQIERTG